MTDKSERELNVSRMLFELETAKYANTMAAYNLCPHRLWPVVIERICDHWQCYLLHSGAISECVCGFGQTPAEACQDFDRVWYKGIPPASEEAF